MSPSYEYQENPWLAHYKREKRISFKAIAWMVLTVVGIYNKLMKQRKKVTILYGTETGKSKKFSKQAVNLFDRWENRQQTEERSAASQTY